MRAARTRPIASRWARMVVPLCGLAAEFVENALGARWRRCRATAFLDTRRARYSVWRMCHGVRAHQTPAPLQSMRWHLLFKLLALARSLPALATTSPFDAATPAPPSCTSSALHVARRPKLRPREHRPRTQRRVHAFESSASKPSQSTTIKWARSPCGMTLGSVRACCSIAARR
jgi:hypothetical protein